MRSSSTYARRGHSSRGQPVISVDTKKKELVGDFKNAGREWHPQGQPPAVRVHDFQDEELGKAIPYGVYDLSANAGWVSVGIDHDTPEFAVESIYCWWRQMGRKTYPEARELLITADGGGSNGTNGSSCAVPASGVPSTCTRRLIGTESGCAGRLASVCSRPARCSRDLAHADDAAAAGLHAGVAHVRQRVEAVLELAGVDDLAVELRRGVEVVVVVVQAGVAAAPAPGRR